MHSSVRLIAVASAIALSGCLSIQNINPTTATQLRAQADAWDSAIVRKDVTAISQNMADTFQHIDSEGRLSNKAQFLTGITSDKLVIQPYEPEDVGIRFYGDVALMTGTTKLQGAYDGKAFKTHTVTPIPILGNPEPGALLAFRLPRSQNSFVDDHHGTEIEMFTLKLPVPDGVTLVGMGCNKKTEPYPMHDV